MTSKNKETIIKIVDSLEAEIDRLKKLLEEDIPVPMKMSEKKNSMSDYVVYGSGYESVTLNSPSSWFQIKPWYGNWQLLKSVEELDKRKAHILTVIDKYEADLKLRYEENDIVSKHNKIIHEKITQIMKRLGVADSYQQQEYKSTRSSTKVWKSYNAGYYGDLGRVAPIYNEYSNYADKVKQLRTTLEQEYAKAKQSIEKLEREEAAKKKAAEDTHKLALLRAKYTPDNAYSDVSTILDGLLSKDKYLKLAHYLELNRGDWNDGYWYAERGLNGFTIDTPEDQEIYDCIYKITQYEDVDGRYFRDCEYSYGVLFGKVDEALFKDYEIVKGMT